VKSMSVDGDDTQSGDNSFKLSDFLSDDSKPEVETVEVEAEEEPEEEGETPEDEGAGENDTAPEAEEEAKPRKGKSVQERFDRLAAEKHEAMAEAAYWRGIAEGRSPQKEAPAKQPEPELTEPNPEDFDFGEEDPAYRRAVRQYDREVIRREAVAEATALLQKQTEEQRASSAASQLEQSYAEAVEAVREELPDYDEKVTEAAKRGDFPVSREMAALIKSSPVGPKVAYHLATNVEEADAVSKQSALIQAAYFGAIAAKLAGEPEKVEPTKKVTSAPPPPKTLNRGSGGQLEPSERGLYRKMLKEFR
jgi:hypothetical protein